MKKPVQHKNSIEADSFHERLRTVIGKESQTSFANRAGISKAGLNHIVKGGMPRLDILAAIACAAGVSIQWLATGVDENKDFGASIRPEGGLQSGDQPETSDEISVNQVTVALDRELFGHVLDRIARTYREAHVQISMVDLGRLAAQRYPEVAAFNAPRDEWQPLLDLLAIRIRKDIQAAAAEPASGKARA